MSQPDRSLSHQITPEPVYLNRRSVLTGGVAAASAVATGVLYRLLNPVGAVKVNTAALEGVKSAPPAAADGASAGFRTDEAMTSLQDVSNYNNFYEFSTSKQSVAAAASKFVTSPWQVAIDGLVHKPKVFGLDEIKKISPPEERIYRMRCVEAWSMVIPWDGIPLAKLLERVEPMADAKFVAFQTLLDPTRMPGQKGPALQWPYIEGLRMDEAMHPLAILATGLYGRELPPQNGAPLRLVVPWKYGFKGIKSIVKITLTATQPHTSWNNAGPEEYGFFANVNPQVAHPRWSQATEDRIGEGRRPTLMFNGYADQVAKLYAGMDLHANY